jgi:ankyrin repeat protein
VNTADRRGFTLLMWASASGNLAMVSQLIDSGAVVDSRSSDGITALMLASANGFIDVARALIRRGADVNASRGGVKARQLALERGHAALATLLEEAEGFGAKLLRAAAEANATGMRQLLAAGAPVNVTDERGATALMYAARNGDLGIPRLAGADASVRDSQGKSARVG